MKFILFLLLFSTPLAAQNDYLAYTIVDEMPRFAGCKNSKDSESCFQKKLFEFLGKNLKYPAEAKRKDITGRAFISFVVEKDGRVGEITVLEDPGGGCGEEAKRVISLLPRFTPGRHKGRRVRIKYSIPINFHLRSSAPAKLNQDVKRKKPGF